MTRVEENQKVCEQWDSLNYTGNVDQVKVKLLVAQNNFLEDISKSLAQLADLKIVDAQSLLGRR